MPRIEIDDANRAKLRSEIELPTLATSNTDSDLPMRAKHLRDSELAQRMLSTKDIDEPILEIPHTETADDRRVLPRNAIELPSTAQSKTDSADPNRA
jgi:hypothetical protein